MAVSFSWGGFVHPDNEISLATLSYQTRYSPRNKKLNTRVTMALSGELIYDTQAQIISKAAELLNAYKDDFKDARLSVDGTVAHALLNTGDCVSGVRVVHRSFPKDDPAELATTRTYTIGLQATYDTVEDDVVSWRDAIELIGTGGPSFYILDTVIGPFAIYLTNRTVQYTHRTGEAVGYLNYPEPPGPIGGLEFGTQRRVSRVSGQNLGNGVRYFTRRWSYYTANDPNTFGSLDPIPISK